MRMIAPELRKRRSRLSYPSNERSSLGITLLQYYLHMMRMSRTHHPLVRSL